MFQKGSADLAKRS